MIHRRLRHAVSPLAKPEFERCPHSYTAEQHPPLDTYSSMCYNEINETKLCAGKDKL